MPFLIGYLKFFKHWLECALIEFSLKRGQKNFACLIPFWDSYGTSASHPAHNSKNYGARKFETIFSENFSKVPKFFYIF